MDTTIVPGYKVLFRSSGKGSLHSCLVTDPRLAKTYYLDRWNHSKPKFLGLGFGLTFFESIETLYLFLTREHYKADTFRFDHWEVFEVECRDVFKPPKYRTWPSFMSTTPNLLGFLEDMIKGNPCLLHAIGWPTGTRMCASMKLVKNLGPAERNLNALY